MYTRELTQAGHVRRFTIRESANQGWEVAEEEDSRILRRSFYRDWHRVERALTVIDRQVAELRHCGWRPV